MSTLQTLFAQLEKLRQDANSTTGVNDLTLTAAVERLRAGYAVEVECLHDGDIIERNPVDYEQGGYHLSEAVCAKCGAVVDTNYIGEHVDEDGDGRCDLCGGCLHDMSWQYVSEGENGHRIKYVCSKCGYAVDHELVAHTDENGDGLCDKCGCAMQFVCFHANKSEAYTHNGDGTHTTTVKCTDCGEIISEETVKCTDANNDQKCDVCEGTFICKHSILHTNRTNNGNGTHTETTTCQVCGKVISEAVVACTDEHGDGICDYCGVEIPADDTVREYGAGELFGIYKYRVYCDGSTLVCKSDTNRIGVAVGAVNGEAASLISGKTMRPIPVPKTATKLIFTAGDTYSQTLSAVFIKGSPSAATSFDADSYSYLSFTNKQCTMEFEAGNWDYVMFNIGGSWTSTIYAAQACNYARLVFE